MHPNRQNGEDSSPADPNPDRRYRQLFEGDRDGILLLDGGTGQIVDANPVLLSLLGSSRDQLLGKRLWEIGRTFSLLNGRTGITSRTMNTSPTVRTSLSF